MFWFKPDPEPGPVLRTSTLETGNQNVERRTMTPIVSCRFRYRPIVYLVALLSVVSASAYAHPSTEARGALSDVEEQGGSTKTALAGTVVDSAGGVIPGAAVVVKSLDTGVSFTTVTNADGAFSVPALDPGAYSVTVSLSGFKTAVV
jgi:Carboxypeptidase regulatory-like domain